MVGFMTRRAAALCAALLLSGVARAAETPPLYEAQAIVTGQEAAERARGLGLCLEDVLIKLSGDPGLRADPRLQALRPQAGDLVASIRYHDRMEGIPIHDEQGTRERPYDLLVSFDPAKTDAALRSLGREPWTGPRPTLALFIGMKLADQAIVLTEDGDRDFAPRLALADSSARRGVPIALPTAAELAGLSYDRLSPGPEIERARMAMGGDLVLIGRLIWSDASLSWQAEWEFAWRDTAYRWRGPAVNFDAGFRQGLEGAEQILSGHGEPR
jgi:hypothetical protein